MSLEMVNLSEMTPEQKEYWWKHFIPYGSGVKMTLHKDSRIPTWDDSDKENYPDIYRMFRDRQDGEGTLMQIHFGVDDGAMVMMATVGFGSTFALFDMEYEIENLEK